MYSHFLAIGKYISTLPLRMINYKYNTADDILYVQYSGEITIDELLKYISEVGNDDTYPRILKILEDRRKGSFPFSILENIKISKHAFQFAKKYTWRL